MSKAAYWQRKICSMSACDHVCSVAHDTRLVTCGLDNWHELFARRSILKTPKISSVKTEETRQR